VFIVYFISRIYPSGEIPKAHLILYNVVDVVVILLLALILLSSIGIIISEPNRNNFAQTWNTVIGKVVCIVLAVMLLAQVHMVFEGRRLINMIRKNHRSELFESI